jgi:hypothetical protein
MVRYTDNQTILCEQKFIKQRQNQNNTQPNKKWRCMETGNKERKKKPKFGKKKTTLIQNQRKCVGEICFRIENERKQH